MLKNDDKRKKALSESITEELRSVTCHIGSQYYLPPDTRERGLP